MSSEANRREASDPDRADSSLFTMLGIWDSALQSYRKAFLTAQSLLYGGAITVAVQGVKPQGGWTPGLDALFIVLVCFGFLVWLVWVLVTWTRSLDVSYLYLLIAEEEHEIPVKQLFSGKCLPFLALAPWQKERELHRARQLAHSQSRDLETAAHDLVRPVMNAGLWGIFIAAWLALVALRLWVP